MEFVRKIMNSDKLSNFFEIPENLRHKRVEVLIFPISDDDENILIDSSQMTLKPPGSLEKYKNVDLIEKEKDAWARVVREKYENR